ncbi:chemotaxis protein CheW [Nitrosomonas sp. ANs5]|uniref:chemotaxis protein CheW n=1 Tax=Nitrosomonas sp. ANs5 TaxID=3423941 RepID=UPI003D334965
MTIIDSGFPGASVEIEPPTDQAESMSATLPVLGAMIGGERWLISLRDLGEVLPVPRIIPVYLTHPWFRGVIRVRSGFYGLCDLAQYMGGDASLVGAKTRALLMAPHWGVNCAILADSMLGFRHLSEFACQSDHQDVRPFVSGVYDDRQGRTWRRLNPSILLRLESFLQIAR